MRVYTLYNEITWNLHLLKYTISLVIIIPIIPKGKKKHYTWFLEEKQSIVSKYIWNLKNGSITYYVTEEHIHFIKESWLIYNLLQQ